MADIGEILEKLESLDIDQVAEEAMRKSEDDLTEANKKQLYAGFDRNGNRLQEYRSAVYAEVKHRMNPLPGEGNPDLKATGSFYRGLYAKVSGNTVEMVSTDSKDEDLEQKYGEEIKGLGGIFKEQFIDDSLRPNLNETISEKTGLKF